MSERCDNCGCVPNPDGSCACSTPIRPADPRSGIATPLRITPDEARLLRYAASNLRAYANEPTTDDLSAENLRIQALQLDAMTDEHPDDWPVLRGSPRGATYHRESAT